MVESERLDFWDRVRAWQDVGWTIALHGYQHVYETRQAGLMGINAYSEFAGLPYHVQRGKIEKALAVFKVHGVRADAWVAPANAFDATTVKVLLELGINVISDGFYCRPVMRLGALWVPMQMWRFRFMPFGLWTISCHINHFSKADILRFELNIERFASKIVSMDRVICDRSIKSANLQDDIIFFPWLVALRIKLLLDGENKFIMLKHLFKPAINNKTDINEK